MLNRFKWVSIATSAEMADEIVKANEMKDEPSLSFWCK